MKYFELTYAIYLIGEKNSFGGGGVVGRVMR